MIIYYKENGWYKIISGENVYEARPKSDYCSCPANIILCKHIKEIANRTKLGAGIINLFENAIQPRIHTF